MSENDVLADKMYEAIKDYLLEQGWDLVVAGGMKILKRGPLKYNYYLQFDITAAQRQTIVPQPSRGVKYEPI